LAGVLAPTERDEPEIVSIDPAGARVIITVRSPDGVVKLVRDLSVPAATPEACQDLAAAAAVVIATWKIQRNEDLSLLQPGVYPPDRSALDREADARTPVVRAAPPGPEVIPTPVAFLGASVGFSSDQVGFVGTARLDAGARRRDSRLGFQLALTADRQRTQVVADGASSWSRFTIGFGPALALGQGDVGVEALAQLFLGITSVEGHGYAIDQTDRAYSLGVDGIVRLLFPGRLQPFLEVGGRGWVAPQQDLVVVRPGQSDARTALPRAEIRFLAGLRFVLAR
jgi:hypothetical protein